jgi:hypothetical protein
MLGGLFLGLLAVQMVHDLAQVAHVHHLAADGAPTEMISLGFRLPADWLSQFQPCAATLSRRLSCTPTGAPIRSK